MKKFLLLSLLSISLFSFAKKPDSRYFEMRIYYCHPGRLDALLQRFTNHTTKIFEKHGMTNVGYWIPNNNTENALYYILAYPSQAARDSSWKHFGADPEWKEVAKKSEESGKIVAKVTSIFMNATDFSPKIKRLNRMQTVPSKCVLTQQLPINYRMYLRVSEIIQRNSSKNTGWITLHILQPFQKMDRKVNYCTSSRTKVRLMEKQVLMPSEKIPIGSK
jgi:hypothetical protein